MIYKRRHPEKTEYYRIIEANFEAFERNYPKLFEEVYGYLRKDIMPAIYAYLDCGIPENGVARVRCECGSDLFVAFSCKKRMICPSCATKRSILFAEKVREIVKPFPHLHMTFTIPKILRGYFRRNRKLLIQSANFAIEQYFHETLGMKDGYTGGIFCIQSHGSLFNRRSAPFPPHIHALVLGGILKDDKFYQPFHISTDVIAEIFRARLLTVLLKQEVITQDLIDLLMSWNHNSAFQVHGEQKVNGKNGDRIETIARYMSRAAISVERIELNSEDNTVTVYEKQNNSSSKKAHYEVFEFMALLAGHLPSPYETITYYYGIYSSSYRGKEKKEKKEDQPYRTQKQKGKAKASANWARLIHKIFEVDPLLCPNCGKEMRIIAFITNDQEVKKILKHIGEETERAPPLPALMRYEPEDSYDWRDFPSDGDFPPDEAYFCDAEWGL